MSTPNNDKSSEKSPALPSGEPLPLGLQPVPIADPPLKKERGPRVWFRDKNGALEQKKV